MQVALESLAGVEGAAVDVAKKQAVVSLGPDHATVEEMIAAVDKAGFKASQ